MRVVVEILYVEVGIGGDKVEHIILRLSEPVLPSFVPTLHEHLVKAVVGGKVDVSFDLGGIGAVASVRLGLGIVGLSELYGIDVIGIVP